MTKKSERAELEEALAWYDGTGAAIPVCVLARAARKHLATLPPDPVKAKELFVLLDGRGERMCTLENASLVASDMRTLQGFGKHPPYRIVRYVPQEE